MAGWHHPLNGHGSEHTPGDVEGLGSLAWCSSWNLRVRHDLVTEQQQTIVLHIQLLPKNSMLKQMRWFFKYSPVFSIVIWTIVFCPWCFKSLDSLSVLINGFPHIIYIFKFLMKYSLTRLFIKRAFIVVFIIRAKIWKQLTVPPWMYRQRKHDLIYVYVHTNTQHTGILFKYKRELSCYLWLYGWMRRVLC